MSSDKTRFAFKPVFKLKDGKSLVKLLKQYDLKGLGGILLEDIQESLPHCEKVLKNRTNEIIYITRPTDKKKILFYNDKTANITVHDWLNCPLKSMDQPNFIRPNGFFLLLQIDEEFKKLWRSIPVDAMDDAKIEEYLEKQGMNTHIPHIRSIFCGFVNKIEHLPKFPIIHWF